jgi:WbqC-like protein family
MESVTATVFSLALFPQLFLFERVLNSDLVFVLTDRRLDARNHANRCVLRSASGSRRTIEIPVCQTDVPIDQVDVPDRSKWSSDLQREVRRTYGGLQLAGAACDLVFKSLSDFDSPQLTDYLMHSFVVTLERLGWKRKIIRGSSFERRVCVTDSEYLLKLCVEHNCSRLVIGRSEAARDSLFHRAGIRVSRQQWSGSTILPGRDSILDAVARLSAEDIRKNMQRN